MIQDLRAFRILIKYLKKLQVRIHLPLEKEKGVPIEELMLQYRITSNKIIHQIVNIGDLQFLKFRDIIYDIFIYNLDITDCIWYILSKLVEMNHIKKEHLSKVLIKTYGFFQYYNNNYRPIYHVENYLLYLAKLIHYPSTFSTF